MNIKVNETKNVEKVYPYIGEMDANNTGLLVLFTTSEMGTVLRSGTGRNKYDVGSYRTDWLQFNFKPFNGDVTLSN